MTVRRKNKFLVSIVASVFISSSLAPAYAESYIVRKGDTIWGIARKFHTSPDVLANINHIGKKDRLAINRCISIPQQQSQQNINSSTNSNISESQIMHTNADNVCLRRGPGTGFERISVLSENTSVKVILQNGRWVKVKLADGTSGFICSSLVSQGAGSVNYSRRSSDDSYSHQSDSKGPLIQTALSCQGLQYRRGGTSRGGFDCSGFTRYIYAKQGVNLPHSSAAQANLGSPVDKSDLKPGDLVFFHTFRAGISHVGIYVGNDRFVHAATYRRGVRVDSLNSGYYRSRYRCARRIKK